jgi:Coenzyme PQQ synthesis protein D (PqqD)
LLRVIQDSLEWERVNGEVIVVSFASGKYFSLSGTAADVWHSLTIGIDESQLIELLASYWHVEGLSLKDIKPFIEDCLIEGLISEVSSREPDLIIELPSDLDRSKWINPSLMTFGNLKDLIMVDPVHDASLINWPLPGDAQN